MIMMKRILTVLLMASIARGNWFETTTSDRIVQSVGLIDWSVVSGQRPDQERLLFAERSYPCENEFRVPVLFDEARRAEWYPPCGYGVELRDAVPRPDHEDHTRPIPVPGPVSLVGVGLLCIASKRRRYGY